jgi:hypothetical protein
MKQKQKKQKNKIRVIISAIFVVLVAIASTTAYFVIKDHLHRTSKYYTYFDCVEDFGTTGKDPTLCKTDDGRTYVEFKIRGISYEECVRTGGKMIDGGQGCASTGGEYIERFPESVNSYNDCQNHYNKSRVISLKEPEACVDKYGLVRIAGGSGRTVNDYVACAKTGGIGKALGTPKQCYYDGVVYYQVLKPSHLYLNPPYELKTYVDCVQHNGEKITSNSSCKSPLGLIFYYNGDPPIRNYKECTPIQGPRLAIYQSAPDTCVGPDGTIYTEQK